MCLSKLNSSSIPNHLCSMACTLWGIFGRVLYSQLWQHPQSCWVQWSFSQAKPRTPWTTGKCMSHAALCCLGCRKRSTHDPKCFGPVPVYLSLSMPCCQQEYESMLFAIDALHHHVSELCPKLHPEWPHRDRDGLSWCARHGMILETPPLQPALFWKADYPGPVSLTCQPAGNTNTTL